jgi:hypothetical protein
MNAEIVFVQRQRKLASNWGKFGEIVHDYLGITYNGAGCTENSVTDVRSGTAVHGAGSVCMAFVDGVMRRYVYDDSKGRPDSYQSEKATDIFDEYERSRLREDIEPRFLRAIVNRIDQLYGVVFHMKHAWIKDGVLRPPHSRVHVGFLAFKDTSLFLIHASGQKGVHIVAWQTLLIRQGPDLEGFGGEGLRGPKHLSVYVVGNY